MNTAGTTHVASLGKILQMFSELVFSIIFRVFLYRDLFNRRPEPFTRLPVDEYRIQTRQKNRKHKLAYISPVDFTVVGNSWRWQLLSYLAGFGRSRRKRMQFHFGKTSRTYSLPELVALNQLTSRTW